MFGKVFVGKLGGKGERELVWEEDGKIEKEWRVWEGSGDEKVKLVLVFGRKKYELVVDGKIGMKEVK